MKRPSLVGQLLTVHLAVVTASCVALVCFALAASAKLLQRNQDEGLLEISDSMCHELVAELREVGGREAAMIEMYKEMNPTEYSVELVDASGAIASSGGRVFAWTPPTGPPDHGRCRTFATTESGDASRVRACTSTCTPDLSVRIVAVDFLNQSGTRSAALGIIGALPLALGAGWGIGWIYFRRRLRPLTQIRDAAAALEPGPAIELGVNARPVELADLEKAFNGLLARIGETLERERRFSGEASHELRTPLTVLRVRLDSLAERLAGDPSSRAEVEAALAEVASLDRLIDALLLLTRSDSAPFAALPVNLCDVARDVARRQAALDGPAGPAPEVDAPDEILVRGNEDLLDRTLGNLVDNARRYAGPRAHIRIVVSARDDSALIQVVDDGPGISSELRPFVFESFVRGPSERARTSGTGLGLAIVRAIVRRHGGDVTTRRATTGGEEVRILLPLLGSS